MRIVWFNQSFILSNIKEGGIYRFSGKLISDAKGLHLSNPAYETASSHTNQHRPSCSGLSRNLRRHLQMAALENKPASEKLFNQIPEIVPNAILKRQKSDQRARSHSRTTFSGKS